MWKAKSWVLTYFVERIEQDLSDCVRVAQADFFVANSNKGPLKLQHNLNQSYGTTLTMFLMQITTFPVNVAFDDSP